jgi:hypothetical protein
VVTGTGAGCTSGACSPVQNTAFPGQACSRKGGSGWGQGRQPAPGTAGPPGPGLAFVVRGGAGRSAVLLDAKLHCLQAFFAPAW